MNESKNKSEEPVIKLISYRITKINYQHFLKEKDFDDLSKEIKKTNIDMTYAITSDMKNGKAELTAHIVRPKQRQIGDVTVVGVFKFRDDIADLEHKKQYLAINGGAMIYPYLRATVSMITALDNPDTTVLPTLNFVEQFKNIKEVPRENKGI